MKNVSIRTKLLIAFSALFLLIVAQGVFSINRLAIVNGLSTEMEVNWLPSTRYVGAISAEAAKFRIAEARHILSVTDEDMNGVERDMEERLSELKRIEAEYEPLATSEAVCSSIAPIGRTTCASTRMFWRCRARTRPRKRPLPSVTRRARLSNWSRRILSN